MPVEIPTKNIPFYDLQVQLEDTTYTLEIRWNERAEAWFMAVLDSEGVGVLQAGLRLVTSTPLAAYTTGRQPRGAFVVVDSTGDEEEPDLDGMGDRWKLLYFSAAELGL